MSFSLWRSAKFLIGLLLLPLAYALTRALVGSFYVPEAWEGLDRNAIWFIGGFVLWLLLFLLLPRPMRTYVLGHELTHALWGLVMGARVSRLNVSAKGGSVTLSKTNVLITLAPYFFPFYMAVAAAVYAALRFWLDITPYTPLFYAIFGLAWSFHITFTIIMMRINQPDIEAHGKLFSSVFIYCINLIVAAMLLHVLTARPVGEFSGEAVAEVVAAYQFVFLFLRQYFPTLPVG